MTDTPQIQALIQEIDEVLRKTSPRLPWVMSTDSLQQRQLLEQTRQYLASLQQQPVDSSNQDPQLTTYAAPTELPPETPAAGASAETAQQVLQAMLQEMNYLRVNMLQPLRSDVEILQRQRDGLIQEIRQLESQRQHVLSSPAANQQLLIDFFQSAMGQMQENLKGQVAQMLASLSAQAPQTPPLLESAESRSEAEANSGPLSPVQRLEHLQMVQAQSDYLLMRLDSTLRVVFESLQSNLQSYQDSLEQGLNRMYHLGQQGEAMFATLVNRLAEQLGREASVYLNSSPPADWSGDRPATTGKELVSPETTNPEMARLLEELDTPAEAPQTASAASDPRWQPPEPLPDPNQEALNALSLELNQLDLSSIAPEPLDFAPDAETASLFAGDRSLLDEEIVQEDVAGSPPIEDDLESALDLLNQVGAADSVSVEEPAPADIELVAAPDRLYDDEFYQSLFGAADSPSETIAAPASSDAENDWFIGGLSELDQPLTAAAEEPFAEVAASEELPQSTERRLLGQPDLPDTSADGLAWLPEVEQEQPAAASVEAIEVLEPSPNRGSPDESAIETLDVEAETITSLVELIPAAVAPASEPNSAPPPATSEVTAGEESYEVAQPHEDLLASDDSLMEILPELSLADDTLQQLTTDLSRLETSTTDSIASIEPEGPASHLEENPLGWAGAQGQPAAAAEDDNGAESRLFTDEFTTPLPDQSDSGSFEGLFSLIPAEPNVTAEAAKTIPASGPSEAGNINADASGEPADVELDELNAFTLEGLESLFENVPAVEPAPSIADPPAAELAIDAAMPPLETEPNLVDHAGALASETVSQEPLPEEALEELEKKKF